MAFIVSGVSVGDFGRGLILRAKRSGITAPAIDRSYTLSEIQAIMLREHDDREYDATSEQWNAAMIAFQDAHDEMQAELQRDEDTERETADDEEPAESEY